MTAPQERRNDVAIGILETKVDAIEKTGQEARSLIKGHVDMCETLHKRVLMGIAGLGLWSVAHSPEGYWTFAKIAKMLLPGAMQ